MGPPETIAMSNPIAYMAGALMIATCLISWQAFKKPVLFDRLKFEIQAILGYRQYYRIFSSALIHINPMHLIFNMLCFYSFGEGLELQFGWTLLLGLYLVSLLGGSLLSLWVHRNHGDYSAVGASGAVSGVIFASIFLFPGGSIQMFLVPIPIPASLFAIVYVFGSMYAIRAQRDNIGHDAHLGGAITGLLFVAVFYPSAVMASLWLFLGIMAGVLGFMVYLFKDQILSLHCQTGQFLSQRVADQQRASHASLQAELDQLLAKVSHKGLDRLSAKDRKRLSDISRQLD